MTNNYHDRFYVWKRVDESFSDDNLPLLDQAWPKDQIDVDHGVGVRVSEMHDGAPMFRFHHSLHMPTLAFCFKARAPYLAAGSYVGQRLWVWDLHTGKLVEDYDSEYLVSSGKI